MTPIEPLPIAEMDGSMELAPDLVAASKVAPASAQRSFVYLAGTLVGGNYIALVISMIGGVLQTRCVLPPVLGLFKSIGLVQGYIPFLQLGILNGLNRELPYFIGKGDRRRVEELAAAAQACALVVGGAVCIALLGVAGWQLIRGDFQLAAGWAVNALAALLLFYNTYYLQMTYRTSHDFARLAIVSVIVSIVGLALVAFVALWGFYGLSLRALLTASVSTLLLFHWRPIRVAPRWNLRDLKHLLIIGAPIFIVGQLYGWWAVLNLTFVRYYTGNEGYGLYDIATLAYTTFEMFPISIGQVVYPRLAEQYGRTGCVRDLIPLVWKPIALTFLGMIPLVATAWLLMWPVARLVVPNYIDAVPAAQWSLLIALLASFTPISLVFNVVRRQDLFFAAIVFGMTAYLGSLLWLTRNGVSLTAFPQAMVIGRFVFVAACFGFVWHLWNKNHACAETPTQS